jgi:hypothetical protein
MRKTLIAIMSVMLMTGLSASVYAQKSRQACEDLAKQRGMHEVHESTQIERFVRRCEVGEINVSARSVSRQLHPNPAYNVYNLSGRFIGADPDPLVRDELLREAE